MHFQLKRRLLLCFCVFVGFADFFTLAYIPIFPCVVLASPTLSLFSIPCVVLASPTLSLSLIIPIIPCVGFADTFHFLLLSLLSLVLASPTLQLHFQSIYNDFSERWWRYIRVSKARAIARRHAHLHLFMPAFPATSSFLYAPL